MNILPTCETISIPVDLAMATSFASTPPEERQKLELLLRLRLKELTTKPSRPLQTIIDEIGASAEAKGLTSEQLSEMLRGE